MKQRKTKRRARRPGRRRKKGVLGYAAAAADEEAAEEDAMDEWSDGDVNFVFLFPFIIKEGGFFLIHTVQRTHNTQTYEYTYANPTL
jgi:hypothetical protein